MGAAEPALITDPRLHAMLALLKAREPIFHTPQLVSTRADDEALLDPDSVEIGASGRRAAAAWIVLYLQGTLLDAA